VPDQVQAPIIKYAESGEIVVIQENTLVAVSDPAYFKIYVLGSLGHRDVSAYSSSLDECDDTPYITASGDLVGEGIVASNCLPFGTLVQIGEEIYKIKDRMNKRYKNCEVDIWMPTKEEALEFGRRSLEVRIIKK